MATRRMDANVNDNHNVIMLLGEQIQRDVVLQSGTGLTPGCIVVPYTGTAAPVTGVDGSTGYVEPPTAPIEGKMNFAVINISSADGGNLVREIDEGEQIPVLYPGNGNGSINLVRINPETPVIRGQFLTVTTDGSGLVTAGTAADAIGIAGEDMPTGDPELPTFIKMEVL